MTELTSFWQSLRQDQRSRFGGFPRDVLLYCIMPYLDVWTYLTPSDRVRLQPVSVIPSSRHLAVSRQGITFHPRTGHFFFYQDLSLTCQLLIRYDPITHMSWQYDIGGMTECAVHTLLFDSAGCLYLVTKKENYLLTWSI